MQTPSNSQPVKLYLGSLPANCTDQMLLEYFFRFGRVLAAIVRRKNGFCTGFGTLVVADTQTAQNILGVPEHFIQGRSIFVQNFLQGKSLSEQRRSINERRVHLKNINYSITDQNLVELFSQFGQVESAYRIVTTRGERRKYGYVSFFDSYSASKCINAGKVTYQGNTIFCSPFNNKNSLTTQSSKSNKRGSLEDVIEFQEKPSKLVRVTTQIKTCENLALHGFFHDKISPIQKMTLALKLSRDIEQSHLLMNQNLQLNKTGSRESSSQ